MQTKDAFVLFQISDVNIRELGTRKRGGISLGSTRWNV